MLVPAPRPDDVIFQMACDALEVTDIPNPLSSLILVKSHGNPLVVKEFVYALTHVSEQARLMHCGNMLVTPYRTCMSQNDLVRVDQDNHTCSLARSLQDIHDVNELVATLHVPVPVTLQVCCLDKRIYRYRLSAALCCFRCITMRISYVMHLLYVDPLTSLCSRLVHRPFWGAVSTA